MILLLLKIDSKENRTRHDVERSGVARVLSRGEVGRYGLLVSYLGGLNCQNSAY
jgi:hypothetical protein